MADSYAALLGMGSSAAAMLTDSGRCVEDYFLYLFVVLIRLFVRSYWARGFACCTGRSVRAREERERVERGAEVKETSSSSSSPLLWILNREDGQGTGNLPSHSGNYPICLLSLR